MIATPVYNYNVPTAPKAWIDSIVRKGVTLGFGGQGLVHGKKATVLMASGDVYFQGSPIRDRDIATQYLRLMLNYIGITDVAFIAAGNAKSGGMEQIGRDAFLDTFASQIDAKAAILDFPATWPGVPGGAKRNSNTASSKNQSRN